MPRIVVNAGTPPPRQLETRPNQPATFELFNGDAGTRNNGTGRSHTPPPIYSSPEISAKIKHKEWLIDQRNLLQNEVIRIALRYPNIEKTAKQIIKDDGDRAIEPKPTEDYLNLVAAAHTIRENKSEILFLDRAIREIHQEILWLQVNSVGKNS